MSDETKEPNSLSDAQIRAAFGALYAREERDLAWAGLMELLDEHWPADIFPTTEDDPKRDYGPRVVSLLRWVDRDRAALARVEAVCATAIRVRTERMVEGSIVHIAAKDAIDTFAEAIREAAMVDTDEPWLRRLPYRDNPDNRPRMGEDANDFLIRMFEQSKHAAITYPAPDPSQFGISDTIKAFIARGRFKR
jgi:hypothetical protein